VQRKKLKLGGIGNTPETSRGQRGIVQQSRCRERVSLGPSLRNTELTGRRRKDKKRSLALSPPGRQQYLRWAGGHLKKGGESACGSRAHSTGESSVEVSGRKAFSSKRGAHLWGGGHGVPGENNVGSQCRKDQGLPLGIRLLRCDERDTTKHLQSKVRGHPGSLASGSGVEESLLGNRRGRGWGLFNVLSSRPLQICSHFRGRTDEGGMPKTGNDLLRGAILDNNKSMFIGKIEAIV